LLVNIEGVFHGEETSWVKGLRRENAEHLRETANELVRLYLKGQERHVTEERSCGHMVKCL
jgi:hypothetical protein